MQIEHIRLYEFDEKEERARLQRNFKGKQRDLLVSVLDSFVAGDWARVHEQLSGMKREQLEFLHPVVYEVLRGLVDRELLKDAYKPGDFARMKPAQKIMGGLCGEVVSPAGLAYPKFRIVRGEEPVPAQRLEPSLEPSFVLVFTDGAFHFKEGSGHPTRDLAEAAQYASVEAAEEAANDLVDVECVARYPTLQVVKSFKSAAKRRAKKA